MDQLYTRCESCLPGNAERTLNCISGLCLVCEGTGFVEAEWSSEQVEVMKEALEESVKLQSHYAGLLNQYDGGRRIEFGSVEEWLSRLAQPEVRKNLHPRKD